MSKNSRSFLLILGGTSVGFVLMTLLVSILFQAGAPGSVGPVPVVLLGGVLFLGAAFVLVAPLGRAYDAPFRDLGASQDDRGREAYRRALQTLGGVPLVALIRLVLLSATAALAVGVFGLDMGLEGEAKAAFAVQVLAFGMLAGAFVFVIADRLGLKALLGATLGRYPADLRENRQQRKTFIIPVFMSVMSLIFAFSLSILIQGRESLPVMGTMETVALLTVLFLGIVLALVYSWNSNTALLFKSVLIQLDLLTQAEKNLASRISIGSVDEIASIAGRVNQFCEGLSTSIREVAATYSELASVQHRLFEGIGTASGAADDIAESIGHALEAITRADQAMADSLGNARELARHAAGAASKITDQSARVASSTAGVQSMMTAVGQLTREVAGARTKTEELNRIVVEGENGIRSLVDTVGAVSARSADLGNINKNIAAVAARTNLLAMNAAIEAAHAGDAGRGFSVVAEEIRILAESTADHTRQSKESLSAILALIQKAFETANAAGTSFQQVRGAAAEVAQVTAGVSSAMADEEARSGEILGLLAETEALGRDLAVTTEALDTLASATVDRLGSASRDQGEARDLTRTMKARNGDLAGAMAQVNDLSDKTAEINGHLASFLKTFKT